MMKTENKTYTLADLQAEQEAVLVKIRERKFKMDSTARRIFAPTQETSQMETMINNIERGVAIYDGVMTGIKFVRMFKKTFTGWRKKK